MTQQMPPSSPEQPRDDDARRYPDPRVAGLEAPAAPLPPGRGTNTMAILAIVFAFVFSPLGIVFGIIGRRQTARTGESGRGLATAGLVLGIVFVVIGLVVAVLAAVLVGTMTSAVGSDQVATQIVDESGGRVSDVHCPSSLPAQVGAQITCSGTVDGAPAQLRATVTSVDGGTVSFDFTQVA